MVKIKPILFIKIFLGLVTSCVFSKVIPQQCPPNIGFENGNFTNWTCHIGHVSASGVDNMISVAPVGGAVENRHTIYSRAGSVGVRDTYGDFPVTCPNGSGYSVKLGNSRGGHEAEAISYEFTIPANRNFYSLVYFYAVVFQNPNHKINEQPRLELEVKNLTDNVLIDCSSFTFIPFGSPLPGFFVSPISDSVFCKDWTPVTINLNGKAGKRIGLTFKTADCTFNRHFGYAYIDVNNDCSGEIVGANYCKDDTAVNVIAPYGFESYNWYSQNFAQQLGTGPVLSLKPPPPPGTSLALEVIPYNGYGCVDTFYAKLTDTLNLRAYAGADTLLCSLNSPVILGEPPRPGVIYAWSPQTGLSDPSSASPLASPDVSTQYILTIASNGGGCKSEDAVLITMSLVDTSMRLIGKNEYCSTSRDSAVFLLNEGNTIQWFKNGSAIGGENSVRYRAPSPGTYFARLRNPDGCELFTRKEVVAIETPRPGINYPVKYTIVNEPLPLLARDFQGTVRWSPGNYLNNSRIINPSFNSQQLIDVFYHIDIISRAGCLTTDFQLVKVIGEVKVMVPNAFTPNNGGANNYFLPISLGADIKVFKVFNRWGAQVFSQEQNELGWNGTHKGTPQSSGTYVWYLEAMGVDKKTYRKKGIVVLIR